MKRQVIRHTTDRISLIGPDITNAIAIKVHGIISVGRRDKLAKTHRTRIRSHWRLRVLAFVTRQKQKMSQL